jgi:ABC-type sugar transport system ATPase subunit
MNFVTGRVWFDRQWQVAFGQMRLTLPEATALRHPRLAQREGEAIIVGFRPETVRIDPSALDYEALDVTVTGVQQLGKETRVLFPAPAFGIGVEVADLDRITNKVGRPGELVMTLSPPHRLAYGDSLRLRVDPAELHLFDALGVAL